MHQLPKCNIISKQPTCGAIINYRSSQLPLQLSTEVLQCLWRHTQSQLRLLQAMRYNANWPYTSYNWRQRQHTRTSAMGKLSVRIEHFVLNSTDYACVIKIPLHLTFSWTPYSNKILFSVARLGLPSNSFIDDLLVQWEQISWITIKFQLSTNTQRALHFSALTRCFAPTYATSQPKWMDLRSTFVDRGKAG